MPHQECDECVNPVNYVSGRGLNPTPLAPLPESKRLALVSLAIADRADLFSIR
jgi:hypothetical protein